MKKILKYIVILISFNNISSAETWEVLMNQCQDLLNKGDIVQAMKMAQQSLDQATKEVSKQQEKQSVSLGKIGQIYFMTNDFSKAAEYFVMEKNQKERVFGKAHGTYILALNNLSSAYHYLGKIHEAKAILKEALEIQESTTNKIELIYAKTLHNYGKVCQTSGDYENAEKYYLKALDIKKTPEWMNSVIYANTIFNMGLLYQNLGNMAKAEKFITQAIDIYRKNPIENNSEIMNSELHLALILSSQGRTQEAQDILSKQNIAGDDNKKLNPDQATFLYNLAMLQWSLKNYSKADSLLKETLTIIETTLGKTSSVFTSCLNSLGIINWVTGNYDKSFDYLSQVVSLRKIFFGSSHPSNASSLSNLAGLLSDMKSIDMAEKYFNESMEISLELIRKYFPFLSEEEKSKFIESLNDRFDIYSSFVIQNCSQKPALINNLFSYRLLTKGLLLNTTIKVRSDIQHSADNYLLTKFEEWKSVREKLANAYNLSEKEAEYFKINTDSLENISNNLEKVLSKNSVSFRDNFSKQRYTLKDFQNNIGENDALVEIIRVNSFQKGWGDNVIYIALLITKETVEHPELVIIDSKNELETIGISAYRKSIRFKLPDESYSMFLSKIYNKIRNKKNIYFSPDGIYNLINLESIMLDNGKYLLDENNVLIVTNPVDFLTRTESSEIRSKDAVLFGNPKFDINTVTTDINSRIIPELPGTKQEIENISLLLKNSGWNVSTLLGEQATKSKLKSISNETVIHIATHGYFIPDYRGLNQSRLYGIDMDKESAGPLLMSGLYFAGSKDNQDTYSEGKNNNNKLSAYEVMNLNLENTELVVLSACGTGLGEVKSGQGAYGLNRAFRAAGAKSIIMSLWSIDDYATQELMSIFYKEWLGGKTKREAFKTAQMKLKEKYTYPYYWGAFVMVGEQSFD